MTGRTMAHDDKKTDCSPPSSLPPDTAGIDLNWDDDVASSRLNSAAPTPGPPQEESEIADRVTAVPELSMHELSAHLMAEADRTTEVPLPGELSPEAPTAKQSAPNSRWSSRPTLSPGLAAQLPGSPPGAIRSRQGLPSGAQLLAQTLVGPEPATATGTALHRPSYEGPNRAPRPPAASPDRAAPTPRFREQELTLDLDEFGHNDASSTRRAADGTPSASTHDASLDRPTLPETGMMTADIEATQDRLRQQLRDRYALGDFSGALEIAEQLLALDADDEGAARFANSCRDVLVQMLTARVGALDRVVRAAVAAGQIRWLSLNHRAGFFLSLVDGMSTAEELLDISGMSRLEALRILLELAEQRVVAFEPRPSHE